MDLRIGGPLDGTSLDGAHLGRGGQGDEVVDVRTIVEPAPSAAITEAR